MDRAKRYLLSLGLPDDPRELLTPEEHAALDEHLANLADQRSRVEAESRSIVMGAAAIMANSRYFAAGGSR